MLYMRYRIADIVMEMNRAEASAAPPHHLSMRYATHIPAMCGVAARH